MNALQEAAHSLRLPDVVSSTPLAGGSIHDVQLVELKGGGRVVCKIAHGDSGRRMLDAEQRGLRLLADQSAVMTPGVRGVWHQDASAVLILDYLAPGTKPRWHDAGRALATLHQRRVGDRYGSEHEVWLGTTCFPGGWSDDWAEWIVEHRLRPLLKATRDAGMIEHSAARKLEAAIDGVGSRIPRHPQPSLLHGDLWSGNIHVTRGGQVAVLDPACFVGDAWMDPAMTLLFGGIPAAFVEAWRDCLGDLDQEAERIAVGQAMHLLNHVHMFGASYVPRLMTVVSTLI